MPPVYSGRFLVDHTEVFAFVESLNHPCVKANLDLGILAMLDESLHSLLSLSSSLIGHVHVSEPNLLPLSTETQNHFLNAQLLKSFLPVDFPVALEMKFLGDDRYFDDIKNSLEILVSFYA